MVNFKIDDVIDWTVNNYNTHITQISRKKGNQVIKIGHLIKFSVRNIFFKNYAKNEVGRLVLDLFLFFKKAL